MKASRVARILVVVSVVVAGLGLAAPPAGAAPALTVTPATGLLDQQIVTVTGDGFAPGEEVLLTQCAGAAPTGCALDPPVNRNGVHATVSAEGTVQGTLRLPRVLEVGSGTVDCSAGGCAIAALVAPGGEERARTPIDFAPTGTAPAPVATLAVAAPDLRAAGGTATYTGSGYLTWFRTSLIATDEPLPISLAGVVPGDSPGAYLALCTPPPAGWPGCRRFVSPIVTAGSSGLAFRLHQTVPVAGDGTVSAAGRHLPRMWMTDDGRVDCAVEDCAIALEQDGAPHSAPADVAWAPEWSPWPSAAAFVTAVYPALLGRPATASERSAAVAGLTDRSRTGFSLLLDLAGRPDARPLAELTRLYLAALGRRPDAPGLLYWEGELRRSGSMSAVANSFGRTPEFRQVFGSVSAAQAVTLAYQRTLGRTPAAPEHAYWLERLRAGLSRTHMIHLFSRTPEYLGREAGRSGATAVIVALGRRSPTVDEFLQAGPGWLPWGDHRTSAQRVDDVVLDLLSSDRLAASVG